MSTPLHIGSLKIEPAVVLAPMAGYTDSAMRRMCRRFGCALSYTEVVNAAGLVHDSKLTRHLLEVDASERPVAAHLYGNDPAVMAAAAAGVEALNRFDLIDINAGCPVRKIVAKGCGAALMKSPARIGEIVRAVKAAVSIPVTVKTRIGLKADSINISEVAQAVEEAGGDAIAIHARVASSFHKGPADWERLAQIKSERSIPVIGNGGIDEAADVLRMFEQTGVDGVMIGRAAVGCPWIFEEIRCLLSGDDFDAPTPAEQRALIEEHLRLLIVLKTREHLCRRRRSLDPDCSAALHFRAHLFKYLSGRPGWGSVRRRLQDMKTVDAILEAVDLVIGLDASIG